MERNAFAVNWREGLIGLFCFSSIAMLVQSQFSSNGLILQIPYHTMSVWQFVFVRKNSDIFLDIITPNRFWSNRSPGKVFFGICYN